MNAQKAKELAEKNVKVANEQRKLIEATHKDNNVSILYEHLSEQIEKAVAKGKMSTEAAGINIQFPEDRFSNEVIYDVVAMLRQNGYMINKETHNAFKTIKFTISWV